MRSRLLIIIAFVAAAAFAVLAITNAPRASATAPIDSAPAALASNNYPVPAPRLYGSTSDWLNTNGKALSMTQLTKEHKVVLIDFWEYTCVNCLRTLPYLQEWNRRYAKDGLVIIGIHTPEFKFAHKRANVVAALPRLGITWPVLVDSNYRNWQAWQGAEGVWPRDYLVDANGEVVEDHEGEGGYGRTEKTIQELLKQVHPNLKFPPVMAPVHSADSPGSVCYPMTAETYCGGRGFQEGVISGVSNWVPGTHLQIAAPTSSLQDGIVYPVGNWVEETESLREGVQVPGQPNAIMLRYHALTANAVIKPELGQPLRVVVLQDGKPIPPADKGADIRYTPTGQSYVLVDTPRMYVLTHLAKYGSHVLTLIPQAQGFGLYSFTFTSCQE